MRTQTRDLKYVCSIFVFFSCGSQMVNLCYTDRYPFVSVISLPFYSLHNKLSPELGQPPLSLPPLTAKK